MARTERYFVGPSLLRDIRRTIARVGDTPYSTRGPAFDAVHQTLPQPGGGSSVRLGKITGSWAKGTQKTVTRLTGDGLAWTPADEAFTATNHFVSIAANCENGDVKVACASVGGVWILIAAEC